MNYIPSGRSRLYRLIAPMPSYYRYALLACICSVSGLFWFYIGYQPLEKYIARYIKCIDDLNAQGLRYKEQCTRNIDLQESMSSLQHSAGKSSLAMTQYPITILESALKVGLLPSIYTQDPQKENSWAHSICMHLTTTGTLAQLRTFLTTLARDLHLTVECSQLELSRKDSDTFICSCTLNVYEPKSLCS